MHFPIFLLISIFFVLLSNAVPAAVPKEANYFAKYQMPVKEMNAIDFESYVAKQKIYVTM